MIILIEIAYADVIPPGASLHLYDISCIADRLQLQYNSRYETIKQNTFTARVRYNANLSRSRFTFPEGTIKAKQKVTESIVCQYMIQLKRMIQHDPTIYISSYT